MDQNEKNINEEVLEEVSGGMPIGNRTYCDKEGKKHNSIPSATAGPANGMPEPVEKRR